MMSSLDLVNPAVVHGVLNRIQSSLIDLCNHNSAFLLLKTIICHSRNGWMNCPVQKTVVCLRFFVHYPSLPRTFLLLFFMLLFIAGRSLLLCSALACALGLSFVSAARVREAFTKIQDPLHGDEAMNLEYKIMHKSDQVTLSTKMVGKRHAGSFPGAPAQVLGLAFPESPELARFEAITKRHSLWFLATRG